MYFLAWLLFEWPLKVSISLTKTTYMTGQVFKPSIYREIILTNILEETFYVKTTNITQGKTLALICAY